MKLTTHLHLVPRLRMSGAVPPLAHRLLWCAQRQFAFIKVIIFYMEGWIKFACALSGVELLC
jgi:hypothetical protein